MRILLATANDHKVAEVSAIAADLPVPPLQIVSLADLGLESPPESVERFETFAANAAAKARWGRERSGLACIADDSGLCVDALGGRPGVRSARWAGPDDRARNERLAQELDAAGASRPELRTACFVCAAAFAAAGSSDEPVVAIGRIDGHILDAPVGSAGFGYDPLFFAPECGMSLAQAGADAKHRVSHRARALRLLASICRGFVP